jgi:hypothetical protein
MVLKCHHQREKVSVSTFNMYHYVLLCSKSIHPSRRRTCVNLVFVRALSIPSSRFVVILSGRCSSSSCAFRVEQCYTVKVVASGIGR